MIFILKTDILNKKIIRKSSYVVNSSAQLKKTCLLDLDLKNEAWFFSCILLFDLRGNLSAKCRFCILIRLLYFFRR